MDDALVHSNPWSERDDKKVLILVVMDDALVQSSKIFKCINI